MWGQETGRQQEEGADVCIMEGKADGQVIAKRWAFQRHLTQVLMVYVSVKMVL